MFTLKIFFFQNSQLLRGEEEGPGFDSLFRQITFGMQRYIHVIVVIINWISLGKGCFYDLLYFEIALKKAVLIIERWSLFFFAVCLFVGHSSFVAVLKGKKEEH